MLMLDQATKWIVSESLPLGAFFPPDSIEVIPGFFNIVHVGNTGAAWSLLTGYSSFLAMVAVLALVLIWLFRKHLQLELKPSQWAFGLIIAGILGNLADRIRIGHVIDFLDFHYNGYHFPSFNVADSCITVGVTIYAIFSFALGQAKN